MRGLSCAAVREGAQTKFSRVYVLHRFGCNDKYGLTLGGGQINNPSVFGFAAPRSTERRLLPEPPISRRIQGLYKAWDVSGTFDWMPANNHVRWEVQHPPGSAIFSGSGRDAAGRQQ